MGLAIGALFEVMMNQSKSFKVGVITMHYPNSGSALQAYATQKKLEDLGCVVEIIDYIYPTRWHVERRQDEPHDALRPRGLTGLFFRLKASIRKRLHSGGEKISGRQLKHAFIKHELNLSEISYQNREKIMLEPPVCDLLVTGSDQVWNPRFAVGDTVFMGDFAPDHIPRISYASSYATDTIPEMYQDDYKRCLTKYDAISVREEAGIGLTRQLTGQDATLVCDPTLLLDQAMWSELAEQSRLSFSKPYLLTYILTYAYDPYPEIDRIIDDLARQTGLDVVALTGMGDVRSSFDHSSQGHAGPKEFVRLFRDASMVITTSFHGTVFSLLFEKNFYSIVQNLEQADSRITSLLEKVGASHRVLPLSESDVTVNDMDYTGISREMNHFSKHSRDWLESVLAEHINY